MTIYFRKNFSMEGSISVSGGCTGTSSLRFFEAFVSGLSSAAASEKASRPLASIRLPFRKVTYTLDPSLLVLHPFAIYNVQIIATLKLLQNQPHHFFSIFYSIDCLYICQRKIGRSIFPRSRQCIFPRSFLRRCACPRIFGSLPPGLLDCLKQRSWLGRFQELLHCYVRAPGLPAESMIEATVCSAQFLRPAILIETGAEI